MEDLTISVLELSKINKSSNFSLLSVETKESVKTQDPIALENDKMENLALPRSIRVDSYARAVVSISRYAVPLPLREEGQFHLDCLVIC
ncbi:hypothetical protein NC652_007279 [Populus alba x Populus x berolinensis]|nr:hypothetical protein NC652_007279 [Populus alba x Populus x berolinensis]